MHKFIFIICRTTGRLDAKRLPTHVYKLSFLWLLQIFGMLTLLTISHWTGLKDKHFQILFQIIMLTGTRVLLSLLGATVALIIILKCIGCGRHLHLLWTMRGHPGQEKDTVKYKSSGMIGDLCYGPCWKLPLDICTRIFCCQSEDIVSHV